MRGEPQRDPLVRPPSRLHGLLLAVTLLALASQLVSAFLGEPVAALAALMLSPVAAAFMLAHRLEAGGRPGSAGLASAAAILVAVPFIALLFDGGSAAALLAPIAFLMVLPVVRGRLVAVVAVLAAAEAGLAASSPLLDHVAASAVSVQAVADLVTEFLGGSLVAGIVMGMVWRLHRDREAAAEASARLFADAPVGLARVTPASTLLDVNPAFARLFGYPAPEAMRGVAVAELLPDAATRSSLLADVATNGTATREVAIRRRDGAAACIRTTIRVERDVAGRPVGYSATAEDITAERAVHDEHERLATIVDAAGLALVAQDLDGTITGWNRVAARLFGWPADTVGRTVFEVSPPSEWEEIRSSTARVAAGELMGPFEVDRRYDGRWLVLEVTVVPVRNADGAVVSIATLARDVTAQAAERRERAHLARQVEESRREETLGRLAGGVAADFNRLLTTIRGYAAALLAEVPDRSPQRAAAEEILAVSGRATEMTHQLIAFARREHLETEVVNLDEVIADQVPVIRGVMGADIVIETTTSTVPALVSGDRSRLAEVLVRLAFSARSRTRGPGVVAISTSVGPVRKGSESRSNEALIRFADPGTPIAPDALDDIFVPYSGNDHAEPGGGLDLPAVFGMVRNMGGRIEASSGPAGTVMTIHLPIAAPVPARPIAATSGSATSPSASVLLVDDDAVVRTISRRILVMAGFAVIEAADAAQARAIADADEQGIDVLVTDVIMPGMHGPDLARLLRELRPDLPVVFISGYTGDDLPDGLVSDHSGYLPKPFAAAQLVAAVSAALARGGRR